MSLLDQLLHGVDFINRIADGISGSSSALIVTMTLLPWLIKKSHYMASLLNPIAMDIILQLRDLVAIVGHHFLYYIAYADHSD
jgi:hypothetical protein